jgi:hypothetical protein
MSSYMSGVGDPSYAQFLGQPKQGGVAILMCAVLSSRKSRNSRCFWFVPWSFFILGAMISRKTQLSAWHPIQSISHLGSWGSCMTASHMHCVENCCMTVSCMHGVLISEMWCETVGCPYCFWLQPVAWCWTQVFNSAIGLVEHVHGDMGHGIWGQANLWSTTYGGWQCCQLFAYTISLGSPWGCVMSGHSRGVVALGYTGGVVVTGLWSLCWRSGQLSLWWGGG